MLPSQPPRDLLGRPELFEPGGDLFDQGSVLELGAVSYTHLTLPTKRIV